MTWGIGASLMGLGILGHLLFVAATDSAPKQLKVSMPAPDFEVRDEQGNLHSLKEFRGKKNVVLAFYPKDFTGG